MLYVQLDVNWVDNPAVMDVGLDGAGLHAMALCVACCAHVPLGDVTWYVEVRG